jgi:hypothetical protein
MGELGQVRRAEAAGALEGSARTLSVALLFEQAAELERTGRLTPRVGSLEGGPGALKIPFLLKQQAEVVGTNRLAPLVGSLIGGPTAGELAALLEQNAEVRRSSGMTALVGSPEGVLGTDEIALVQQQHAEVERGLGMSALVSSEERILSVGQITLSGQEQAELERGTGVSEPIRATERIRGRRWLTGLREDLGKPENTRPRAWSLGQAWLRRGTSALGAWVRDRLAAGLGSSRRGRPTTVAPPPSLPHQPRRCGQQQAGERDEPREPRGATPMSRSGPRLVDRRPGRLRRRRCWPVVRAPGRGGPPVDRAARGAAELTECLRAGNAVDGEMAGGLKSAYRALGHGAVPPVDGSRREARDGEVTLQGPNRTGSARPIPITRTEHELSRSQGRPGHRAVDPVDDQPVRGLEAAYRLRGQRPVASVDRSRRIVQAGQPALQRPNRGGAVRTGVTATDREHPDARSLAAAKGRAGPRPA